MAYVEKKHSRRFRPRQLWVSFARELGNRWRPGGRLRLQGGSELAGEYRTTHQEKFVDFPLLAA